MLSEESEMSTPQLFSDECMGLDSDECKAFKDAVDITSAMAEAGCSEEDMEEIIGRIPDLMDGVSSVVEHVCRNGASIRIVVREDGRVSVETSPPGVW